MPVIARQKSSTMGSQREARDHIESIRHGVADDGTAISRNLRLALGRALEV